MTKIALETEDVHVTHPGGVRALDGVSVEIAEGETVVLIGESGSGKTTLLRLFNRLQEPTSGQIRIAGRPARSLDAIVLRRATGYVQQEGGLLPHWSVGRNVELVPLLLGWEGARSRRRANELLDLVGLPPATYRDRYPAELSGGQRQRVAFARAVAADPEVILLDEPFGALDALTRLELQREFLRLKRALGKTMVLVTDGLREAFLLGDRIAVMKDGRIAQIAAPDEIRSRPAGPAVLRLVELLGGEPR